MVAALGALDVEVVAIALLFALLAGALIVRPLLVGLAGQLPVVGPQLATRVGSVINAWLTAMTPAAQGALGAFSALVAWVDSEGRQLGDTVAGFAQLTYSAIYTIDLVRIPHAVDAALARAEAIIQDTTAYVVHLLAVEDVKVRGLITADATTSRELFAASEAYATQVGAQVEADARALTRVAEQDAAALVAEERAFAVHVEQVATGYADALFAKTLQVTAAAEAALNREIGSTAAAAARDLTTGVSALERQIADAKAAMAAVSAAGIAAVAADVAAVKDSPCMRACDVLGAAGAGLQLLDLAAILALAEAARTNPRATQQFLQSSVAPMIQGLLAQL